jgi:hypothetical protein
MNAGAKGGNPVARVGVRFSDGDGRLKAELRDGLRSAGNSRPLTPAFVSFGVGESSAGERESPVRRLLVDM